MLADDRTICVLETVERVLAREEACVASEDVPELMRVIRAELQSAAAPQLRELIAAARNVIGDDSGNFVVSHPSVAEAIERLDKALTPFDHVIV